MSSGTGAGLRSFSGLTHLMAYPFIHMFPGPPPFCLLRYLFKFILQVPYQTGIISLGVLASAQEIYT